MSQYSQQINSVLVHRLVPEMSRLATEIVNLEPYSFSGPEITDRKKKLSYIRMLYDFLQEYVDGEEFIDHDKLITLVMLAGLDNFALRQPKVIPVPPPVPSTIFDIDGNEYHYVTIGTQQWLVENLKTTKYADGELIPNIAGYNDWFLPSKDELTEIDVELHQHGLGGFGGNVYWSSSEFNATVAWYHYFGDGSSNTDYKTGNYRSRACRAFTSISPSYNLRDIGPAGGWVFWKSGNDYLECAPSDITSQEVWSDIDALAIGTTGTAIGTGQANTTAIIGQVGHTTSAAKLCNDLTSDMLWAVDTTGAYCYYNNDIANKADYGALYNWYAATNVHGLAPTGWRVPSDADFATLIGYVGGDSVAGGKLKEVGLTHWTPTNTGATDEYGFSAGGAGMREFGGQVFTAINITTLFKTSTGTNGAVGNVMINGAQITTQIYPYNEGKIGGSVRCMRDI